MSLYKSDSVLKKDVDTLVAGERIDWDQLRNSAIMVTGATGLIGGQIVSTLLLANREKKLGNTIILPVRNVEKAKKMFDDLLDDQVVIIEQDIAKPMQYEGRVDYLIHGASMTSSKDFVEKPVETIQTAIEGTDLLLKYAKTKELKAMVYLSSMEVYGVVDSKVDRITESTYGYIEQLSPRSSYSEGKRMVECLCASYAHEYQVPVKIARLTQTFGPGVAYQDGRVFAEFARCVIEGRDIVLHTEGLTERNYCYTKDAVAALLRILTDGEVGVAYNVANEDTLISIRDMAQMLTEMYPKSGSKVVIEIEDIAKHGYNPTMRVNLATDRLKALGWQAEVSLKEMFENLICSMKAMKEV